VLNPRDFEVKKFDAKNVILVDDIVTTNLTLTQALKAMQKENKEVLFCLTLADASIN
jgi:competence protein ComFC